MALAKIILGAGLVHLTLGTLYTIAVVRGLVYIKHCDELQADFADGLACFDADKLHPDAPYSLQVYLGYGRSADCACSVHAYVPIPSNSVQ